MMNMFKLNQKGQADTVFEVLIAVILMSFVLLIGSFAMQSLSKTKCTKEINSSINEFSRTISLIATNPLSSKTYLFDMPVCFGPNYQIVLEKKSGPICQSYCTGTTNQCWLLHYYNPKDKVSPVRYKCVNIAPSTTINDHSICNSEDNFENLTDDGDNKIGPFKRNKYLINSNSITKPTLCIYSKKQGE